MRKYNLDSGVIVWGGHIQALGIVRIYGRMGIQTVVVDKTSKCIARHSKYCNAFFCISDHDVLSFLIAERDNGRYKGWLLFPTNDLHVKILGQNKSILEPHYRVTTDVWQRVQVFYNKKLSYKLAEELNVPYPKTFYPETDEDLKVLDLTYPCVVKPAVMHSFYSKVKKKVFLCNSQVELMENYKKALSAIPATEIIVQEVIPGASHNQFSACFLFLKGESFVSLTACRMRQHPIDFGNATTYAEVTDTPKIVNYAKVLLKEVGYNGLCEVEFKLDERDGEYKFLEVNPRTWKWHSISNKANAPFLQTYYRFLLGNHSKPHYNLRKASFFHFLTDMPTALAMLFKGHKFWSRLKRPIEQAVWTYDDLKPWVFEKIYIFYFINTR